MNAVASENIPLILSALLVSHGPVGWYQPSEPIFHECSSASSSITSTIATLREHDESILAPFALLVIGGLVGADIQCQLYMGDNTSAALHGKGYALN